MAAFKDLSGSRFSRYLVLGPRERRGRVIYWLCRCDCGVEKFVKGSHLTGGLTHSCGCLHSDRARDRSHVLHEANTKTGLSKNNVYSVWSGMKSRCGNPNNPAYPHYGGRGIAVCERWQKFENFLADMGMPPPGMTIDREDNDGNYEKNNCRWISRKRQQRNQRVTRKVTIGGKEFIAADLAEHAGLKTDTIVNRAKEGLPLSAVVSPKRRVYYPGLMLGWKFNSGVR